MRSLTLDLPVFLRGGHQNCDLYVVGVQAVLFFQPNVQAFIQEFVANGKGLLVVGPDVQPAEFYAPDAPHTTSGSSGKSAKQEGAAGMLSSGTGRRLHQASLFDFTQYPVSTLVA